MVRFLDQDSRFVGSRHENPVNNLTIRKPKFGLVGYTTITIDTLAKKKFRLENVPKMSPLEGGLEMKLAVHSESRVSFSIGIGSNHMLEYKVAQFFPKVVPKETAAVFT